MVRDLDEMMDASFAARVREVAGQGPDGTEIAGLARRVRRRRAVRHATQGAVVLPLVAAVAVAGWWVGVQREPVVPVDTPSPTSTPSPTPSPEPRPEPSTDPPVVTPVALADEPGLPTRYAPTEGLLEIAGAGWVLATAVPAPLDDTGSLVAPTVEVLLLIDPAGTAYELLRRDPALDVREGAWRQLEILEWRPPATQALVRPAVVSPDRGVYEPEDVLTLDLLTGATTPTTAAPAETPYYIATVGGRRLFSGGEGLLGIVGASGTRTVDVGAPAWLAVASPGGDLVLVENEVVDLDEARVVGSLPQGGQAGWCSSVGWWTATAILAKCLDEDPAEVGDQRTLREMGVRLVTFEVSDLDGGNGALLRRLELGDVLPFSGLHVSDRLVSVGGTPLTGWLHPWSDPCAAGEALVGESGTVPLPSLDPRPEATVFSADAVGGRVAVETRPSCGPDIAPSVLSVFDPVTTAGTVLLPAPDDDPPGAPSRWAQVLTSWVMGG
ncbi:hypothetical protein [Actinotalea sp. K2]|uniref:hypothetical protein n=1 Tax=Actinotalea sp. K2 TaxID=2939438 RepID=UPI002016F5A2|nr:hypothetical protein [Actinotalea sp. K2]MCL3860733.1 hypothetical protein [Actinotalea sp. K2]